jgi:transcriptional regulator with XRE-family HTH domain
MSIDAKESEPYKELAKRIRDVRSELGLNQSQFAAAVGVSTSIPRQWESGAFAPRKAMLERIARVVPEKTPASEAAGKEPPSHEQRRIGSSGKREDRLHTKVEESDWPMAEEIQFSPCRGERCRWSTVVLLDRDLARASRTDVHTNQLRSLDVDWESLLLPFGQRWANLKLLFTRTTSP